MLVQSAPPTENPATDNLHMKENEAIRHEMHHFIWNFLERRGDFLKPISESSPAHTKAFRWFRDEISAHLISKHNVSEANPKFLTYVDDEEILAIAKETRDIVSTCVQAGQEKGMDPQTFLYAVMRSRNFVECRKNVMDLIHT